MGLLRTTGISRDGSRGIAVLSLMLLFVSISLIPIWTVHSPRWWIIPTRWLACTFSFMRMSHRRYNNTTKFGGLCYLTCPWMPSYQLDEGRSSGSRRQAVPFPDFCAAVDGRACVAPSASRRIFVACSVYVLSVQQCIPVKLSQLCLWGTTRALGFCLVGSRSEMPHGQSFFRSFLS